MYQSVDVDQRVQVSSNGCNTYLLLNEFEVRAISYGPSFFPFNLWPKREAQVIIRGKTGKKRGSVTYSMDRKDEVSKIFILSLLCA